MALTISQLLDLGFKPTKKSSPFMKKYDTLVYYFNSTDHLYIGYDEHKKQINNKIIWKSFVEPESGKKVTYPVVRIGDTGFTEIKEYIKRSQIVSDHKPEATKEV